MLHKKYILTTAIAVCLAATSLSCRENKWHKYLVGAWMIDSINYHGYNINKCFLVDAIAFKRDNTLFLPKAPEYTCPDFIDYVQTGTFKTEEINNDSAIIEFNTENHFFRGKHLLVKRGLNKYIIEIKSDSLYILLRKAGFQ